LDKFFIFGITILVLLLSSFILILFSDTLFFIGDKELFELLTLAFPYGVIEELFLFSLKAILKFFLW
jgi:hypothetical protein